MKVVIREEIIIEDPSKEMLDYIHTNLITDNPEYDSRKRMGLWLGGVDPYILFYRETVTKDHNYVTVPFGCLKLLKPFLTKDTQFHSVLAGGQSVSYDGVDLSLYETFARGFLEACGGQLTEAEKETLPDGAWTMSLENGMRFLADYLEGDHYFHIARPEHNLDRSRAQLALVREMEEKEARIRKMIREIQSV